MSEEASVTPPCDWGAMGDESLRRDAAGTVCGETPTATASFFSAKAPMPVNHSSHSTTKGKVHSSASIPTHAFVKRTGALSL